MLKFFIPFVLYSVSLPRKLFNLLAKAKDDKPDATDKETWTRIYWEMFNFLAVIWLQFYYKIGVSESPLRTIVTYPL